MKALNSIVASSLIATVLGAAAGWWGDVSRANGHSGEGSGSPTVASRQEDNSRQLLRDIRPIVTNLAAPQGAWVRLEMSLVLSQAPKGKVDQLVAEFVTDSTDFLRNVTAHELEGPSGLRRLREDLLDRARFRIGGEAESILIQTLVIQ